MQDPFADIPDDGRDRGDPFADIPDDAPSQAWKRKSEAKQNAVRAQSEIDDEENRSLLDRGAHAALGAADAVDTFGLADEVRGMWGAARGALPGGEGIAAGYTRARDAQREATSIAQDESPMAYGVGNTAGIIGSTVSGLAAAPGRAAVGAAARGLSSAPASSIAKGAGMGAALGGGAGFGHAEGDIEDQLLAAVKGGAFGAGLGAAGAALPAAVSKLAPSAANVPLTARNAAPTTGRALLEGAGNIGRGAASAARSTGAALLNVAGRGVDKIPMAAGAGVGGAVGGPLGAAAGAAVGEQLGGTFAKGAGDKLRGAAQRLNPDPVELTPEMMKQPPPAPPAPSPYGNIPFERATSTPSTLPVDDALLAEIMRLRGGAPSAPAPTQGPITQELQALKARVAAEGKTPSTPSQGTDAMSRLRDALEVADDFDPRAPGSQYGEAWEGWLGRTPPRASSVTPPSTAISRPLTPPSTTRADRTPPRAPAPSPPSPTQPYDIRQRDALLADMNRGRITADPPSLQRGPVGEQLVPRFPHASPGDPGFGVMVPLDEAMSRANAAPAVDDVSEGLLRMIGSGGPPRARPAPLSARAEGQRLMAETALPRDQAMAAGASIARKGNAERMAADVMSLPPEQRGPQLQALAKAYGPAVARAVAKAAGLSVKLLGLGGAP